MPIYNWWKVNSTGDLSFVLLEAPKKKLSDAKLKSLDKYWQMIFKKYISEFGFSEDFLRQIEKKKQITILTLRMIETDDLSLQTEIDLAHIELLQLIDQSTGQSDFYETKISMERNLGFVLDPKKITVREFYSYVKNLKKYSKQRIA